MKRAHLDSLRVSYPERHETFTHLLQSVARVLQEEVLPSAESVDQKTSPLDPVRRALFRSGVCQLPIPEKYGGAGLPFSVYALAVELAGAADASAALSVSIHGTVSGGVARFGNEAQKKRWIPELAAGRKLGAFCLTEPASGSDAGAMATAAEPRGDGYRISGTKTFITNAGEADLYLVFARAPKGPAAFLVEGTREGLSFGDDIPKLGMRGSRTAEVMLDCEVGKDALLGEEGKGLDYAKTMLNSSRIVMAALVTGISQIAFDKAVRYSSERRAFGHTIGEFQLTKEKIADMSTEMSAARALYLHAAMLSEGGADFSSEAAQAKLFATEMALRVCDRTVQICGGYGYTTEDVHRHWRDARLLTIGEGTSEILRMLIARKEMVSAP